MTGVVYLVTLACLVMFGSLVLPTLVAFSIGETVVGFDLLLVGTLGFCIALLLFASFFRRRMPVTRSHGLMAVVLIWLIVPVAGALPFVVTGETQFVRALFVSVSGLTTTGANSLPLAALTEPLLVWRSTLEWVGGFLTLACVIHIMAPSGIGGIPQSGGRFYRGEGMGHLAEVNLGQLAQLLIQYAVATLVVAALMLISGTSPMYSLLLAMTAISTGGFLPFEGSIATNIPVATQFVFAVALLLGASSILWQRAVMSDIRRVAAANIEAMWIVALFAVLAVLYGLRLISVSSNIDPMSLLVDSVFAAASVVSTSGLETRSGILALLPELLVLFVIFTGASVFSTAGGVKLFRIGAMLYQSGRELALLIHPNSVAGKRFSGAGVSGGSVKTAWTVFIVAVLTIAAGTFTLSLDVTGFQSGFTAAVAFFTNSGPIYEALRPPGISNILYPPLAELGTFGMIVGIVLMLLGRLEVLVVLCIININYWIRR